MVGLGLSYLHLGEASGWLQGTVRCSLGSSSTPHIRVGDDGPTPDTSIQ